MKNIKHSFGKPLSVGFILLFLAGCMNPSQTPLDEIIIKPEEKHQVIEGFGASAAWWAQDVGGWEDEKRKRIVELLFNPETGIGLTIFRYNIGAGLAGNIQDPWRTAETFEVSPGVYDWSRDANAIWVMKAAQAEGADQFLAFVNSPPARMTISGLTTGGVKGASNLSSEMYDDFAQYMVDVVRHLREDEGIPVSWISPVNEPQWSWNFEKGQEGNHYGPVEVLEVTRALIRALEANGMSDDVKVSVFESGEWKKSQVYIDKLLKDPEVAPHLEHLAIHSYWSKYDDKRPIANFIERNFPGTKIWQTEWTEMKEGRDTGMESALVLANTVQEDLSFDSVTSWQYWIAVSRYFFRDGLIYVNLSDRKITETKRLWALGNFSRYIRPGDTRIGAETGAADVTVSAYLSPESDRMKAVVINSGKTPVTAKISGIPAEFSQVRQYETSENNDLVEVYFGKIPASLTFPAESVTTLVFTK
jgi:O-glycosyl hydrolase